jgi:hypothetical protein
MQNSQPVKPLRALRTVRQLHQLYPAWSEAALRALILNASDRKNSRGDVILGNGLDFAIVRCAGKVLIDEQLFLEWVAMQSMRGSGARSKRSAAAQQEAA